MKLIAALANEVYWVVEGSNMVGNPHAVHAIEAEFNAAQNITWFAAGATPVRAGLKVAILKRVTVVNRDGRPCHFWRGA